MVFYRHQKAEEAQQAMQAYRSWAHAEAEAMELARTHDEEIEPTGAKNDLDSDDLFHLNAPATVKGIISSRHQKAEEAQQAMQAYCSWAHAEAEAMELARTHDEEIEPTGAKNDLDSDDLFHLNDRAAEAQPANDQEDPDMAIDNSNNTPEVEQGLQLGAMDEPPIHLPPGHHSRSQTPTPPHSPPPLDIQYDSDESESDYQFSHVYADPPALRLAYLNALSDHIVRKHPVRDVEISLRNTISCLRLIPNGLPLDVKPLTTLKSVRHHLGLDTSRLLLRVPVCSKCYKRYTMEDVSSAVPPAIKANALPRAPGVFYDVSDGSAWKSARIGLRRVFRRDGTVSDEPITPGSDLYASDLGYGLFAALNIDWFSLTQKRSSGTIYLAILNLPRHARYQVQNVILAWKSARIGLCRVFRRDGTVSDEPITPGSDLYASDLGYGLFAALNIDWFSLTQKRSSGAIYLAILNLPRHARYQVQNVILACVISGPTEPSLESLNFVLEPIVESFKRLYAGVVIKIYNENLPPTVPTAPTAKKVYMYPLLVGADVPARSRHQGLPPHMHRKRIGCDCDVCQADLAEIKAFQPEVGADVPARSKHQGLPPHMHRKRIGCDCDVCQADLAEIKAFQPEDFTYLDEWHIIALSKQATESQAARNRIAKEHGIRWSAFNELPGWMPHASAPFDPMHCLYLGIVNRLWCDVIEDGYLLSTQQKAIFEAFLTSLRWPSQIGRLPSPTTTALNRRKADEWRRLISILPLVLWISWRNGNDEIVSNAPPVPAQVSKKPAFTRDILEIWECVVYLTASIRLFTSWIAYRPDIERAQSYMAYYCQRLRRLSVRLQPNHHFALHLLQYFDAYGPCYAWWLFPFERFNGILEDIELNGHPDDMDTTLARWWIRTHLLHNYLEGLPENASAEEQNVLNQLHGSPHGEHGTLLAMTESLHGQRPTIKTSSVPSKYIDLRSLDDTGDTYLAVLKFAQNQWPHLELISNLDFIARGRPFLSHKSARQLQFIHRNGIRYGCASSLHTKADQHALLQTGDERPFVMNGTGEQLRVVIAYDRTGCEIFEDGEAGNEGEVI
ncbi:hypothetical protein RSAG8_13176, partial [Rhizoctonia solani AG-8 WAC10335]